MIDNIFVPLPIKKRAEEFRDALLEITGCDCLRNSRRREYVTVRMIACYQLRKEGVLLSDIGRIFNRDHSTIVYYEDRMEMVLSCPGYEAERQIYKLFKRKIG